jgi:hypothetical protein
VVKINASFLLQNNTGQHFGYVATANGKYKLIVPIQKGYHHVPHKYARIANQINWQSKHWRSIRSAYGKSPFFEYYADEVYTLYSQKFEFLLDLNEMARLIFFKCVGIKATVQLLLDDKDLDEPYDPPILNNNYKQVFQHKHGFLNDVTAFDMLFNVGPETILLLKQ